MYNKSINYIYIYIVVRAWLPGACGYLQFSCTPVVETTAARSALYEKRQQNYETQFKTYPSKAP